MFIRLKTINGKKYAYRVRNKWTAEGARQKSVGYLGKAYILPSANEQEYCAPQNADVARLLSSLISWEMGRRGIERKGDTFIVEGGEIRFSPGPLISGKKVVLKLGAGYLCHDTIIRILNFRKKDDEDHEQAGRRLAEQFIASGINVPTEIFVRLYEKASDVDIAPASTNIEDYR